MPPNAPNMIGPLIYSGMTLRRFLEQPMLAVLPRVDAAEYLVEQARHAIWVVRKTVHKGIANSVLLLNSRSQPRGAYRYWMFERLCADSKGQPEDLEMMCRWAAAAIEAKAATCRGVAAMSLLLFIKNGVRCRVTYVATNPPAGARTYGDILRSNTVTFRR